MKMIRIVITGGPCSGKSSVIKGLLDEGFIVIPEAARSLISKSEKNPHHPYWADCVPWKDFEKFQIEVTKIQDELEAMIDTTKEGIVFQDRSAIDNAGYCKVKKSQIPGQVLSKKNKGHYHYVFMLDLLPQFKNDAARKETPEEAKAVDEAIYQAYVDFGYTPIRVPVLSIEERVKYILEYIHTLKKK